MAKKTSPFLFFNETIEFSILIRKHIFNKFIFEKRAEIVKGFDKGASVERKRLFERRGFAVVDRPQDLLTEGLSLFGQADVHLPPPAFDAFEKDESFFFILMDNGVDGCFGDQPMGTNLLLGMESAVGDGV